jgi:hypothetical protein
VSRVKVPLADNLKRVVFLEEGATEGATFGRDLRLPDGTVLTLAILQSLLAPTDADPNPLADTIWRPVREIPPNVRSVELLNSSGLVTRKVDGSWVTRTLGVVADGLLAITDGNGDAGNPMLAAATINALSVWGRAANTVGKPAPIVAASDGDVMRRDGSSVGFGTITQAAVINLVSDLAALTSALAALVARQRDA